MDPGVPNRETDFLQKVEKHGQLLRRVRLACEPLVENSHTDERLPIEDRHGNLRPENLKFLADLAARLRLRAFREQDATLPVQVSSDAGAERKGKVLEHRGIQPDRAGGTKPPVL